MEMSYHVAKVAQSARWARNALRRRNHVTPEITHANCVNQT
jgi:hypothetical protein